MGRLGIRDLVGRLMTDKEFLAELLRDPQSVLAEYELTSEERSAIMQAVGRSGNVSDGERARALQNVMMMRWAT